MYNIFKNSIVCIIIILLSNSDLFSATIKGNLKGLDFSELEFVKIKIKELNKTAITNNSGNFIFDSIPIGNYTFQFRRVGIIKTDAIISINSDTVFNITLNNQVVSSDNVIITGTRTEKDIESSPIYTQVYSSNNIKQVSATNLPELLSTSASMNLINDHGKGVQIQGLDPAYTTIMIDGNPLIGREGGTLDLDRINLSNVKRIEIIKGAASSIYGSTALAGVINVITDEPMEILSLNSSIKYEQNKTFNINSSIGTNLFDSKLSNTLSLDYTYNNGFTNNDMNLGLIIPKSNNFTIQNNLIYYFDYTTKTKMFFRYNYLLQENSYLSTATDGIKKLIDDNGLLNDFMYVAEFVKSFENFDISIKYSYFDYKTDVQYLFADNNQLESRDIFHQYLSKIESINNFDFVNNIKFTSGIGTEFENIKADRIVANDDNKYLFYCFIQSDYLLSDNINIILSARYDKNKNYKEKFSPKFAFSYSIFNDFIIKGSVGTGFKAPDFRQLYMNWSNPEVGYSVFGVSYYEQGITELLSKGLIIPETIRLQSAKTLLPESSISYNIGFSYFGKLFSVKTNLFRNNLKDMIATIPVAQKTNNQQVFTYTNLNKVMTQGLEANLDLRLTEEFRFSISYQYLEAIDEDVVDKINKKEIFKQGKNGIYRPVEINEYGGLLDRSPHCLSIKLNYKISNIDIALQGTYRSKYGFEDNNGNSILDEDSEYAFGYSLWDIFLNYQIKKSMTLKTGMKNIFDYTNNKFLVYNTGRNIFISIAINFNLL